MQIPAFKTLAILAFGAQYASAYVITMYSGVNCDGDSQENNVWDNTCSTPSFGFQSFKPKAYGGGGQKASFTTANSCSLDRLAEFWADGGDDGFQIDKCVSFGEGHFANAAGSFTL
ncbi:hypothetical protein FQN54_000146 [Arachnomyces sp. PD_36]|nr:hypothetical protein FQN54_000146 [Arachnomyces sp. PD_36]